MKRKHLAPFVFLAALVSSLGGAFVACTSNDAAEPGVASSAGGATSESSTGETFDSSNNSTTGSSGAGGATTDPSGQGGQAGSDPAIPPDPISPDGGTKPVPACDTLDKTMPAIVYMSNDDSNSMASAVHCRDLLNVGLAPKRDQVRTYEFLNYYNIDYPAADPKTLKIYPEFAPTSVATDFDLQVALRSYKRDEAVIPRRPMNLVFVIDTSGSMQGPGLDRAKKVIEATAGSLKSGDLISMVTWNEQGNVLLSGYAATGPNDPEVLGKLAMLTTGEMSNLSSGLSKGYELAKQYHGPTRMSRVVLITDGGANVSVTDATTIGEAAEVADKENIYLVGVATGPPLTHNDDLMNTVTEKGRGAYVYLDSVEEAQTMFSTRFDEVMDIAARSVRVELTLPWYFKLEKFYGEGSSTDAKALDPQHLAVDDAMIFSQVLRACDPSVVNTTDEVIVRASWTDPELYTPQLTELKITLQALLDGPKTGLPKGKAIVAYAEALKQPTKAALAKARKLALDANPGGDKALDEIVKLIEKHPLY